MPLFIGGHQQVEVGAIVPSSSPSNVDFYDFDLYYSVIPQSAILELWINGSEIACAFGSDRQVFGLAQSSDTSLTRESRAPLSKRYSWQHDYRTYGSTFSAFFNAIEPDVVGIPFSLGGRVENNVLHAKGDGFLFRSSLQRPGRSFYPGFPVSVWPDGPRLEPYLRNFYSYGDYSSAPYVLSSGHQPAYVFDLRELLSAAKATSDAYPTFPYQIGSHWFSGLAPFTNGVSGRRLFWASGQQSATFDHSIRMRGGIMTGFSYRRISAWVGFWPIVLWGLMSSVTFDLVPPSDNWNPSPDGIQLINSSVSYFNRVERTIRLFSQNNVLLNAYFNDTHREKLLAARVYDDEDFPGWLTDDVVFENTTQLTLSDFRVKGASND